MTTDMNMTYKFEVIKDKKDIEKYLEHDHDRILDLLKKCFNPENEVVTNIVDNINNIDNNNEDDLKYLTDATVFLCKVAYHPEEKRTNGKNDKVIGIAANIIYANYINTTDVIRVYDPIKYVTYAGYDDSGNMEIFEKNNAANHADDVKISYDLLTLNPCIYSLCKDKAYKDVGKFLLDNICNYYNEKGYTRVYIIPESNKHRYKLLNKNMTDDTFVELVNKYKSDQLILKNYYEKNNFSISKKYYSYDLITLNGSEDIYVMFYNVMVRIL